MTKNLLSDTDSICIAAEFLKLGQLVAFPTETVYGLGASIFDPEAIQKIFLVKGRPQDNPLIAHVASLEQIEMITCSLNEDFYLLYKQFFPGPLTIVLERNRKVSSIVSGGGDTIAFRMPNHPIALQLIEMVGYPLVAPSANLSGKPSSTTAAHVLEDFEGKIAAIIDGGSCSIGLESTVISLCSSVPILLRPGAITKMQIENVLKKEILLHSGKCDAPLSPGMKYRHYAPKASVHLFECEQTLRMHVESFQNVKRLIFKPSPENLYAMLRRADKENHDEVCILCDADILSNAALMNRLLRASEKKQ